MKLPTTKSRLAAALLFAALAIPSWLGGTARAGTASDDNYDDPGPSRVGRISQLDGEASVREAGSGEWRDVNRNVPLFEGDELYTGDNSRAEVQLGGGRYLRLDERTDVVFAHLDSSSARIEMPVGSLIVSVDDLDTNETFEVSAPAAAVTLRERGVYRIDVDDTGDTRVAVRRGSVDANGTQRWISLGENEVARFSYSDPYAVDLNDYPGLDNFDNWSAQLDRDYNGNYTSSAPYYGSLGYRNDIYGLAELINYGSWVDYGGYGQCWVPRTGMGWQPYSDGYWEWIPGYGYTWVSNEAWGWAPYHYGRWAYLNGYGWAWVPWSQFGPGSYYWTPAQVYWYQYPGQNGYAWVPLAPNEPYVDYRPFAKHRHRDFVPVNLNTGRGVGLAQPGSGARLVPVKGKLPDGGAWRGRTPVGVNPSAPTDARPIKPKFDTTPVEAVRLKPVVVKDPKDGAAPVRSGGVVTPGRRPVREAVDSQGAVVEKPRGTGGGRTKADNNIPTWKEERPLPTRREPVGKPDKSGDNDGSVVVKPGRRADDSTDAGERPKPRRIDPVGPPAGERPPKTDRKPDAGDSIDRQPKVDRQPRNDSGDHPTKVDRPRNDDNGGGTVDRQPKVDRPRDNGGERPRVDRVERVEPRPERQQPPPQRHEPSGGGGGTVRMAPSSPPPPPPSNNSGGGGGHKHNNN